MVMEYMLDIKRNTKVWITDEICGPDHYGRISHHRLVSLSSSKYIEYYVHINLLFFSMKLLTSISISRHNRDLHGYQSK
jgi:hypothetical protein